MPYRWLTDKNVKTLRALKGKRTDWFDGEDPEAPLKAGKRRRTPRVRGFHLRVSPTGARSFGVYYWTKAGRQRRATVGTVGSPHALADARDKAEKLRAKVTEGRDPAQELRAERLETKRQREAPTLAVIGEKFLVESKDRLRPNTLNAWTGILKAEIATTIGKKRPDEVTRADVRELVEGIAAKTPTYGNRVFELVRRIYSWAIEKDIVDRSPCAGLKKPTVEKSRDRVLSSVEIQKVWDAAGAEGQLGDALRLLFLTGARREEVLGARVEEIDLDAKLWSLPARRSKTGERRAVPLSEAAVEIVERLLAAGGGSEWLFPSERTEGPLRLVAKTAASIRLRSGVSGWVWHDIRRTVRTRLSEMGVAPHVAEAVLGHARSGIERVYNKHEPVPEMRSALGAWSARLHDIVTGKEKETAAVVPFGKRGRA